MKPSEESRTYNRALGTVLAQLRELRHLTQQEVGDAVARSKQAISKFESGDFNVTLCPWELVVLAKLFGIQPEEFFLRTRDVQERHRQVEMTLLNTPRNGTTW